MALVWNKISKVIYALLTAALGVYLGSIALKWMQGINANETILFAIPALVFIATIFAGIIFYSFLRIFIFQQRGIKGYLLRGKILFYLLSVSVFSVLIVGGIMLYLIFLIENTFVEFDQGKVSLEKYKEVVNAEKNDFEKQMRGMISTNASHFPVIFTIDSGTIRFQKNLDTNVSVPITGSFQKIQSFFEQDQQGVFYLGANPIIIILRKGGAYFAKGFPEYLNLGYGIISSVMDYYNKLDPIWKNLRPFSLILLLIFSMPIFLAVLFISFLLARSITSNIEQIAQATRKIAEGKLDTRVELNSRDEIGDLATNFNKMAISLKRANEQIKRMERFEAWQEMAKKLAHEIKNPLTPIKLSAERLLYAFDYKPDDFPKILNKTAATIIQETKRLENLVNEFSKFARLPYLKKQMQDMKSTLDEIVIFFQGAYSELDLETQFPHSECVMEYDSDQLKQVLINIVTNAIEASAEARKYVRIELTVKEETALIAIRDRSGGIPDDNLDKVFEPYFTTKQNGTGLGLVIAEKIIMEHNGNIWFDSNNVGTTFYIELPLNKGGTTVEKHDSNSG